MAAFDPGGLDPRVTPARADLAAAHLKGKVVAERFVEGGRRQVIVSAAALRRAPDDDAMMDTQALFGDEVVVYDSKGGWAWVQMSPDGYVGWLRESDLTADIVPPTHEIAALRTYAFAHPDMKSAPRLALSLACHVSVVEADGKWSRIAHGGWVYAAHLRPLGAHAGDWVSEAERFVGTPYIWGGKDSFGLDCSGLVQTAMASAGRSAPRDADMQEALVGKEITIDLGALKRGDLVFWTGHVGIMLDGERLLHANSLHMMVSIEPIRDAVARIENTTGPVTSIRRTL